MIFSIFNFNSELTKMCIDFLPGNIIYLENALPIDLCWNAHIKRLQYNTEVVVGMDEDCFLFNMVALYETIRDMQEGKFAFAGCPEGVVSCRKQHDKKETNSFFCILNIPVIRELDLSGFKPEKQEKENYWPIFREIAKAGNGRMELTLKDYTIDPITTVVCGSRGDPMAFHTWYGRDYANPKPEVKDNKIRIQARYQEALARRVNEPKNN